MWFGHKPSFASSNKFLVATLKILAKNCIGFKYLISKNHDFEKSWFRNLRTLSDLASMGSLDDGQGREVREGPKHLKMDIEGAKNKSWPNPAQRFQVFPFFNVFHQFWFFGEKSKSKDQSRKFKHYIKNRFV